MNAARYVGRVGALAVALGVGMGVSSNLAVALADGAGDSPAPSGDTSRPAHRAGVSGHRGPVTASAPADGSGRQSGEAATPRRAIGAGAATTKTPTAPRGVAASTSRGAGQAGVLRGSGPGPAVAGPVAGGAPAATAPAVVMSPVTSGIAGGSGGPAAVSAVSVLAGSGSGSAAAAVAVPVSPAAVAAGRAAVAVPAASTAAAVAAPKWSAGPLAPLTRAVIGLLLSLGGMTTTDPQAIRPFQKVLLSLAKGINNTFAPAPPPGTPTVAATDLVTGVVSGSLGFPTGGGLTFTATQPAQGAVALAQDGTFTYTPTLQARQGADTATTDTFIATVHNGISSSSVRVTVPVDPGTPIPGTATVTTPDPDSGIVTGAAVFTDTAGRTLTYHTPAASSGGGAVSIDAATGVFSYTPSDAQRRSADLTTTDSFILTTSNGVRTATQTVSVAVAPAPVNAAPSVTVVAIANPDGTTALAVAATDPDGDPVATTAALAAGHGVLAPTTGGYLFTPDAAYAHSLTAGGASTPGSDTVTVTGADGHGGSATATAAVIITPVNQVPAVSVHAAANPDGTTTLAVTATDGDGDPVTLSAALAGGHGVLAQTAGGYLFTPDAGYAHSLTAGGATTPGSDTVTVTGVDGHGGTVTGNAAVSITPVNQAPIAGAPGYTLTSVNLVTGTVSGIVDVSDPDGDPLTYSVTGSTTHGQVSIDPNTGVFSYTPTADARDAATAPVYTAFETSAPLLEGYGVSGSGGLVLIPNSTTAFVRGYDDTGAPVLAVYDLASNTVTSTLAFPTSDAVGGAAVSPDGTHAYVPTYTWDDSAYGVAAIGVAVIDTATNTITATIPFPTNTGFNQVVVSPGGTRAYAPTYNYGLDDDGHIVVDSTAITIIDTTTNTIASTIAYPTVDFGYVAMNPAGTRLYVSTYLGQWDNGVASGVAVIDTTTGTVAATIDLEAPNTAVDEIVISPDGQRAYLNSCHVGGGGCDDSAHTVIVLDTTTNTITDRIAIPTDEGSTPSQWREQLSPDGRYLHVLASNTLAGDTGGIIARPGVISVIDTATNTIIDTVPFTVDYTANYDNYPINMAISPDGAHAYLITETYNYDTNQVSHDMVTAVLDQAALAARSDTFTITATDGVDSVTAVISVPIGAVASGLPNHAPTVADSPNGAILNGYTGQIFGSVIGTDPDGDTLAYSVVSQIDPAVGSVVVDSATGQWTFTPTLQARLDAWDTLNKPEDPTATTVTFSIVASDGQYQDSVSIAVVIDPVAIPVVGDPPYSITASDDKTGTVTGLVNINDPDGGYLWFGLATAVDPSTGQVTLNSSTGAWTFTPTTQARRDAATTAGEDTITFTITAIDPSDMTASVPVTVAIAPNRAPTPTNVIMYDGSTTLGFEFYANTLFFPAGQGFVAPTDEYGRDKLFADVLVNLRVVDPDGDPLTYTITTPPDPTLGTVSAEGGVAFRFTPSDQARETAWLTPEVETASFTYSVSDGQFSVPVQVTVPIVVKQSLPSFEPTDPAVTAEIPLYIPWGSWDRSDMVGASADGRYLFLTGTRGYDIDGLWLSNHIPGHAGWSSFDGDAETVAELWVIDTTTNTVQANVASLNGLGLGIGIADSRWLEHVADALSPDGQRLYQTFGRGSGLYEANRVFVYDTATGVPVGELQIGDYPGSQWTGRQWGGAWDIDIDPSGEKAYVLVDRAGTGQLGLVTLQTQLVDGVATQGTELALGVGGWGWANAAWSLDGSRMYVVGPPYGDGTSRSYGESVFEVVDTAKNTVTVVASGIPRDWARVDVSADGTRYYLTLADTVVVYNAADNAPIASVPTDFGTGSNADRIVSVVSPTDHTLYLAGRATRYAGPFDGDVEGPWVAVISPDNSRHDIRLSGNEVVNAAVSDDGKRLYVITGGDGGDILSVIDTATNSRIDTATLPDYVVGSTVDMHLSDDGTKLYLAGPRLNTDQPYDGRLDNRIVSVVVIDTTTFKAPVENPDPTPQPDYSPRTPSSIKGLYDKIEPLTSGTAEGVAIQFLEGPYIGSSPALIVYIGGTQDCATCTNQSELENSASYTRQVKKEQTAIIDAALAKAPGASIMLVGFSQGGMDAQNIAASGRYDVTSVVTFGSPIVQPASMDYYTINLWDTRDNIAKLTDIAYNSWPQNFHQDAIDAHQLFTFRSSTYDPGDVFPGTEPWWAVHINPKTYEEISDAFVAQISSDQYQQQAYKDIQRYLGAKILTAPAGFVYVDGTLMPTF